MPSKREKKKRRTAALERTMRLAVAKLQHYLLIEIQDERPILRPTP